MNRFGNWPSGMAMAGATAGLVVLLPPVAAITFGWVAAPHIRSVLIATLGLAVLAALLPAYFASTRARRRRTMAQIELDAWEAIAENLREAVIITDAETHILRVNAAFCRLTGYTPLEVMGSTPQFLKSGRHTESFYSTMWNQISAMGFWQGGIWNKRKDGRVFFSAQTISSIRDLSGKIARYISVIHDLSEMQQQGADIAEVAYHDILTNLPNRYLLQDRLMHAVELARRNKTSLAVMFIDLDRFKVINDSLGHEVGDLLLIESARRLKNTLRNSDTIARLGGDEFVILLPEVGNEDNATDIAEQLNAVMVPPMHVKGRDIHIGASIGITLFPRDGETASALMKNADTAMYRSKAAGPNSFRFFDKAMNDRAVERMEMESALRLAVLRREFVMHYQPKIDLQSGAMVGAEALIRWPSPEFGLIPPGDFIPLAEETGLIGKIGDWVLEEVCHQLADWRIRGISIPHVAVNVSSHQFLDNQFTEKVEQILAKHDVPPACLEIELTEGAMMLNPEAAVRQLLRLQEIGVVVSVDDFGTGYSSLTYLKRLPIGTIKVDQSFVRHVHDDQDNAAIVAAIQGMAEALGMSTVAEGIETKAEENHLREAGCSVGQGFHYSRALSVADFEAWLEKQPAQANLNV